jgi:N-acetyltransferase
MVAPSDHSTRGQSSSQYPPPGPCTLEGQFVKLEPLRESHTDAMWEAARQIDWELMLRPLRSREAVVQRILDGLKMEEKNEEYGFVVIGKRENRVVGSTAYLNVVSQHRRLEIGSTWYTEGARGTAVNPESKLLLLEHAFEHWQAVRVQLGTHVDNVRSQRAILKLGAKFEGRLRSHGIIPDGTVRDAFLYSIIASEWPEVKKLLLERLASFGSGKDVRSSAG